MMPQLLILDFGSQYTQLIARRIRELNVYCEIHPYNKIPIWAGQCKGIILSGSPFSALSENALQIDLSSYLNKIPTLGICYGAQYIAHHLGGEVVKSDKREYGKAHLTNINNTEILFKNISDDDGDTDNQVWMSHADTINHLPPNAVCIASTNNISNAAYKIQSTENKPPVYGLQFHPEVTHSKQGKTIFKNFVYNICGVKADFTPERFIENTVAQIKETVGEQQVIMGLSGGVDSSVAATLIHQAIGKQLVSIFVDNGLLRKNEFEEVLNIYQNLGFNVKGVNAKEEFYNALKNIDDPERKRKLIGKQFIAVFEREAAKVLNAAWLGQGTIYPDVIESVSVHGPSAKIKSHHNVGGLPKKMQLKILEPLNRLFKDEVREVGKALGLPHHIVGRHPFPGPGLAIRILGDLTPKKVELLQKADHIFVEALKSNGLYDEVWQAGAILLPVKSVGVMGDERTYENVVALRAVTSVDGMTAEWCNLPYDFLANVSTSIINNVKGINRVVYDISTKPPATIEWE